MNDTFKGGFSYRDNILNKPPTSCIKGLNLGSEWRWAPGAGPEHLLNALTVKGYPVSPGRWIDGRKNKNTGTMVEAAYILLDYDANMTLEEAKRFPYFVENALFLYTSSSHQKIDPETGLNKGDRFRVCFAMDRQVTSIDTFNKVIAGLKLKCPGSDPAINGVSLLYGNNQGEVHIFNLENRLDTKKLYLDIAVIEAERKINRDLARQTAGRVEYGEDNSIARVQRWLSFIPNDARSTWVRVAGCLRNIEGEGFDWPYTLFCEWSARDYADFDPSACEALWDSLTAAHGGFWKLKMFHVWFQNNPDETELPENWLEQAQRYSPNDNYNNNVDDILAYFN